MKTVILLASLSTCRGLTLPGSYFSGHHPPLGEEIFVLEGTFSDEHGDYEEGTYLRNPPGSFHQPFSQQGCTILEHHIV